MIQVRAICSCFFPWSATVVALLILVGCHRDPPIPPADDGICRVHWIWNFSPPDTLIFGEASSSHAVELTGLPGYSGDTRIYLSYQHTDVQPGPGVSLARYVRLSSGLDSIGYHPNRTASIFCESTRASGDTLDPFMSTAWDYSLYSNYPNGCVSQPPTWLVGFAKLIQSKRHSGYVRVRYLSGKYFIDEVRVAKCPGMPMIIEAL